MPIQNIPGIYDQINQGLLGGQQSYQDQVARNVDEQQRAQATAMQKAQVLATLFGQGAVNSSAVTQGLQGAGIQGVTAQPNEFELRRRIAAGRTASDLGGAAAGLASGSTSPGVTTPGQFVDDVTRKSAGLPSNAEQSISDFQNTQAQIRSKFAAGGKLTDQEYQAAGIDSPSDKQIKDITALDPVIRTNAQNYVADQVARTGGRLNGRTLHQIASAAFAQYANDRKNTKLGSLTPEETQFTEPYFYHEALAQMQAQEDRDIKDRMANNRATPQDRLTQTLQDLLSNNNSDWDKLMQINPTAAMYMDSPDDQVPAPFAGAVKQLRRYRANSTTYQRALAKVAVGNYDPREVQSLISGDSGSSTPTAATSLPPATIDDLAVKLNAGRTTQAALLAAVNKGQLSQDDYNLIINTANKAKSTIRPTRPR